MRKSLMASVLALSFLAAPAALAADGAASDAPTFAEMMDDIIASVTAFSRVIFIID
jgi:hypothetical protein